MWDENKVRIVDVADALGLSTGAPGSGETPRNGLYSEHGCNASCAE